MMRVVSVVAAILLAHGCSSGSSGQPDAAGAVDAQVDSMPRTDAAPVQAYMYVHTRDELFIVDDQVFSLLPIGPFANGEDITDLAVAPSGNLFGISKTKLFAIDRNTGAAAFKADVGGVTNVGLTFLRDGNLLATDATGGVRKIDPDTGVVTEIGTFGGGYATAGDLVAVADGTMYAISDKGPVGDEQDNNVLLTIDTSTGVATPIGQIGYGRVFGCAYANGKVYAFTAAGEIIEINRATGQGTLKRSFPVSFWGAGVTPLVVVE